MDLAKSLARVVGPAHVLTDPALTASYETDWTRRWRGRARLVVRPADTEQVAACVAACAEAGVPIVPQGGNTGLVGGGVPTDGEVVLSLTRLSHLDAVDRVAGQVTVGAGATVSAVRAHARAAGLDLGVDLASRDSATVGGVVATNAGGERVLRYGPTRQQVLGLEAVLADGRVVRRLTGLVKDNVGYDLGQLLVGSEGTLGVVTRARLRLVPYRPVRAVALAAVADTAAAQALLAALRERLDLEAAELFHAAGLDLVCAAAGLRRPFPEPHPTYLLVECAAEAGRQALTERLAAAVAAAPGVRDAAVAGDAQGRAGLWAYRERHTEAINTLGVPLKLDVAVPPAVLPEAEQAVRAAVATHAPAARLVVFGHLAEANLHVNVVGVAAEQVEEVSEAVLQAVAAHQGSISAEHGVGRAKVRWVHLSRSAEEIAVMRAVKRALDPHGLLNPGVLLPT